MRFLNIEQMNAFICKKYQLLFSNIVLLIIFLDVLFHMVDFWNTPFQMIGFLLEGSTWSGPIHDGKLRTSSFGYL